MATCRTCKHSDKPKAAVPCSNCRGYSNYEYEPQQNSANRIREISDENQRLCIAFDAMRQDRDYYRDAYHHLLREKEEKMSRGLQYDSGRDMPPGMQVAMARKIIENEVAALIAALKETDVDCQFCTHAWNEAPCMDIPATDEIIVAGCGACPNEECTCHSCKEKSNYKWCGAEEANRRLAAIAEAE